MNNSKFKFSFGQNTWVKLENRKEKKFSNFNDANSWSIGEKSPIIETRKFDVKAPKNYNPSNESVVHSHVLLGGNIKDFSENFLNTLN